MMLTDDELRAAEHRARRFQGAWTGTSGSLAADSLRQIQYIRHLQGAAQMNFDTTAAAHAATDAPTDADFEGQRIPADWILRGERELKGTRERHEPRPLGAGVISDGVDEVSPAETLLQDAISVVRDRRPKYGGPRAHFARTVGMINAAFSDVLKRPLTPSDWALIMTLDKVARFLGPTKTSDQITDLAGYAACLAECEAP